MSVTDPVTVAGMARQGAGEPCVLLKLGEIVLKGRNRQQFERLLHANIRAAVRDTGLPVELLPREGVVVLRVPRRQRTEAEHAAAVDRVAERVSDVPGIVRVCRALRVPKTPEAAVAAAIELTSSASGAFAVRARRRDKRFPVTSAELAVVIGREVQAAHGLPVNLSRPDTEIFVEVDQHEVFVFTGGLPGQGGLPVGMSGRAVVLMSGGIDSPVAAYRMMRRGLRCSFLHFSGMPLTGPESIYKAYALVRGLDRFQGGSRLFVVPFGKAQQALATSGADRLQVVAQRRLMLKTAEALAKRLDSAALVTGDSLGQVSSQTLPNIAALDDAVSLPILRPLLGWDKTEIMAEARRIRTLAISELPDQDCCTLLTPRRVETRARIDDLRRIEGRLDAGELAEQLAASAQEYRPELSGRPGSSGSRARCGRQAGDAAGVVRFACPVWPSGWACGRGVRGGVPPEIYSVRPASGDRCSATLASSRRSDSISA
ncbi:MAG TPA: tRNA uracil 4-sulfurtransferase ThiI [Trebonia sp.]|nr:tRNA uracil 4-sulfurtransferase ThiI [Trebonia sp.]